MVKLAVLFGIAFSCLSILSRPYLAAIGYQAVSYMQAHAVWFWVFENIPVFMILGGMSIVGWSLAAARKAIDLSIYKYRQNALLLSFLILMYTSNWISPYPKQMGGVSTDLVQSNFFTIVLMYFVCIGLCSKKSALKLQIAIILMTTLYFTYWANSAYLSSQWSMFYQGRLMGLVNSQYRDGNLMSIIYVMGMPFLFFLYKYSSRTSVKYMSLLALPFVWHAVFLHSSRGAFLSLAVSTLFAAYLMRAKVFSFGITVALIGAFFIQGGELLNRSEATVTAGGDIQESSEPINPRLTSWKVGLDIALEYPLFGAGTQRFLIASAHLFPGRSPHVAHNTIVSYAANLGFPAAIVHILILITAFKYRGGLKKLGVEDDPFHAYVADASTVALAGYAVCSVFLDLTLFEPFYFILSVMLINQHVYINGPRGGNAYAKRDQLASGKQSV